MDGAAATSPHSASVHRAGVIKPSMSAPRSVTAAAHWGERLLREAYEALCELPPPAALIGIVDQLEAAAMAAMPANPEAVEPASL